MQESAPPQKAINEIKRPTPFILAIGPDLSVVTAGRCFSNFGNGSSTKALLTLLATYYIFDLDYSDYVKTVMLFLQSEVLKLPDDSTASSTKSMFCYVVACRETLDGSR